MTALGILIKTWWEGRVDLAQQYYKQNYGQEVMMWDSRWSPPDQYLSKDLGPKTQNLCARGAKVSMKIVFFDSAIGRTLIKLGVAICFFVCQTVKSIYY